MHDALGVIECPIEILPLVPLEHVILNAVQVPVVGGTTQGLDNLHNKCNDGIYKAECVYIKGIMRDKEVTFGFRITCKTPMSIKEIFH